MELSQAPVPVSPGGPPQMLADDDPSWKSQDMPAPKPPAMQTSRPALPKVTLSDDDPSWGKGVPAHLSDDDPSWGTPAKPSPGPSVPPVPPTQPAAIIAGAVAKTNPTPPAPPENPTWEKIKESVHALLPDWGSSPPQTARGAAAASGSTTTTYPKELAPPPAPPKPPAEAMYETEGLLPVAPGPAPMNLKPLPTGLPAVAGEFPAGTPLGEAERRAYASPMSWEQQQAQAKRVVDARTQFLNEKWNAVMPHILPTAAEMSPPLTPAEQKIYDQDKAEVAAGRKETPHRAANVSGKPIVNADIWLRGQQADFKQNNPNAAAMADAVQDKISSLSRVDQLAVLAALPQSKLVSLYFGYQMGKGATEGAEAAYSDSSRGNRAKAVYDATGAIVDAAMAGLALHHGASGARTAALDAVAPIDEGKVTEYRHQQAATRSADQQPAPPVSRGTPAAEAPPGANATTNGTNGTNVTSVHPPIGAEEPETGRPVLQQSPRPEVSQAAATAEHPEVKKTIEDALKPIAGAEMAGARDEKDSDRLEEKIEAEGQSPRTVRDYSGYRIAVDSPAGRDQVVDALKQKFEVVDEQDNFDKGDEEHGFHAHTVQVREPGSPVTHEVQILPREVADSANSDHGLYEKAREGDKDAAAELKAKNDQHWQEFQDRQTASAKSTDNISPSDKSEPKYKHGNTQVNIPDESPAAQALNKFREGIPAGHLAGDGKDVGDGGNHVTVRYGIQGDDTGDIEKYIRSLEPFTAHLGDTDVFPPSEYSDGAAVVHAKVEAPELTRINDEIQEHGDFAESNFKDYRPHATVAYIDPAQAEAYKGRGDVKGAEFPVNSITISDRDGNQREIPLGGTSTERKGGRGDSPEQTINKAAEQGAQALSSANEAPRPPIPPENRAPSPGAEREPGRTALTPPRPPASLEAAQPKPYAGKEPLRAPVPPGAKSAEPNWERGEHFIVRDAKGNYSPGGTVDYWNDGINGAKPGGRAKLSDGTKLDEIPAGAVRIEKAREEIEPKTGTPEERKIINAVHADRMGYLHRYVTDPRQNEGGRLSIAVDAAKKLIPGYSDDPIGTESDATAAAIYIRDMAEELALKEPFDPARPDVQIATASPGSGKTTLNVNGEAADRTAFNIEHIMTHLNPARDMLQRIIDTGRKPVITWVHVDEFGKTVERMFRRSLGDGETAGIGRTVPLDYMADAYRKVPRTLEKLKAEFGDKIVLRAVDNSGTPEEFSDAIKNYQPLLDEAKRPSYNQLKAEGNEKIDQLGREGLFDSERGKAALASVRAEARAGSEERRGPGDGRDQQGGGGSAPRLPREPAPAGAVLETSKNPASRRGADSGGSESAPAASVSAEERAGDKARATQRISQREAANKRSLAENARGHKSTVETIAGRKAVVLDSDGEGVWHRVFAKLKSVNGENPLGAGSSWRGLSLDKSQVKTALSGLKDAADSARSSGDSAAARGYETFASLIGDATDRQGSASILRSDYRMDTAREEAWHQWQREHGFNRSYALATVADQPEFAETVARLRARGYKGATPRTVAMEIMAKALAGDPSLDITAREQEALAHAFLSEAAEEKGGTIFDSLPDTDPRLGYLIDGLRKEHADGGQLGRAEENAGAETRGGRGSNRGEDGPGDGAGAGARRGEPDRGGVQRSNEEEASAGSELGPPLFQRALDDKEAQKQNPWFLKSAKVIDEKMRGPMAGSDLVRMLENNGVKPEELKWSGLEDLRGDKRVTPEQVKQHLAENSIKLKEVTKGDPNSEGGRALKLGEEAQQLTEKLRNSKSFDKFLRSADEAEQKKIIENAPAAERPLIERYAENGREAHEMASRGVKPSTGMTRYGSYQLPGGENYREMLLTLPHGARFDETDLPRGWRVEPALHGGDFYRVMEAGSDVPLGYGDTRKAAIEQALAENKVDPRARESFQSGHWDEENILGHVRFNDRNGPNGEKLLHLEELQSDWHQQGRTAGYQSADKTLEDAKKFFDIDDETWGKMPEADRQAFLDEMNSDASHVRDRKSAQVPEAPFKKTWPELLMKRMVRYAAEHGYDGVSWTPGEQQAERYDLSKQADSISYARNDDGTYSVSVRKDGARGRHEELLRKDVAKDQLSEVVGKEAAQKIIDGVGRDAGAPEGSGELKGLDLKVGGEGMKGFYDKIVPDVANKIGKPFGAKVGETTIETGKYPISEKWTAEQARIVRRGEQYQVWAPNENGADQLQNHFETHAAAERFIADHKPGFKQATDVPYLPVTDEMRGKVVSEGLSLFQRAETDHAPGSIGAAMDEWKRSEEGQLKAYPDMKEWDLAHKAKLREVMRSMKDKQDAEVAADVKNKKPLESTSELKQRREQESAEEEKRWAAHLEDRKKNLEAQKKLPFGGVSTWQRALGAFRDWRDENPDAGDDVRALIREKRGEMDRQVLQLKKSLEDARKDFVTMPRADVIDFIDHIEHGRFDQIPEKYRGLAEGLHAMFVNDREQLQRLDPEKLKNFYENYFPHIWDRSGKVARMMQAQSGKKSLFGSGSFLQHRTLDPATFREGIDLGLEPKTWNPIDMALMKHAEIQRYIFGLDTVQNMKAQGIARLFKKASDAPPDWVQLDDRFATVMRPAQVLNEKKIIDATHGKTYPGGTNVIPSVASEDIRGATSPAMVLVGHYYAPEEAARSFNNFVSRGLVGRNGIIDAGFTATQLMNSLQLGLSAFHLTASALHTGVGDLALGLQELTQGRVTEAAKHIARAPVPAASLVRAMLVGHSMMREYLEPGAAAKYEAEASWLARAGGRPEQSVGLQPARWRQMAEDIRRGDFVRGAKGAIPSAIDAAGSWLMRGVIPRIKMGSFQDMASNIIKEAGDKNWDDGETRKRMQAAWDSVDNRYGQMIYDNLFWHRTALDAARLGIRSVGWNLGSAREYFGGALSDTGRAFARTASLRKPEVTGRMAFTLATPIYFAMATATMDYLTLGHGPDTKKYGLKAYFYPEKADGTLMSLPGYMKDWFGFGAHPVDTVINKSSPLLGTMAEMWQNKDYYGNEIRNEDDPLVKQALAETEFLGNQYLPLSLRSLQEQRSRAGEGEFSDIGNKQSAGMNALSYLGFQPAPQEVQNSPAMNLARHYQQETPTAPRTTQQAERSRTYRNLVKALESGDLNMDKLQTALQVGKVTFKQLSEAQKQAHESPLAHAVEHLSAEQAFQVWQKANPQERQELSEAIEKHRQRELMNVAETQGMDAAEELDARLKKMGIGVDTEEKPAAP